MWYRSSPILQVVFRLGGKTGLFLFENPTKRSDETLLRSTCMRSKAIQ